LGRPAGQFVLRRNARRAIFGRDRRGEQVVAQDGGGDGFGGLFLDMASAFDDLAVEAQRFVVTTRIEVQGSA
jgi:hypothetical protein